MRHKYRINDYYFCADRSRRGFTLAEVMVALVISGFLLVVANQMLQDINKWMADISIDAELVEIAQSISSRVNCEETFKRVGITATSGIDFDTQVQLYDQRGRPLFQDHSITNLLAYKKISEDWLVDVTWVGKSFRIYAGKVNPATGEWARDPINKTRILDFAAPGHWLYGNAPNNVPLCPKRATGVVLLERISTTSGQINSLLGLPDPGNLYDGLGRSTATGGVPSGTNDNIIMSLTPLTFARGCHRFCRKPGNNYTSGSMVGLADWSTITLANGDVTKGPDYPSGSSVVICECYL